MRERTQVKKLALSGILLAFAIICVFLAASLPTSRLTFYALSSLFLSVIIIESGLKLAWAFYIASSLLSVVLVPRLGVIPYIVFFGIYGLIKFYSEKTHNRIFEYIIKIIYFNICLFLGLFFAKEFLLSEAQIELPLIILAVGLELVFFVYDYVYTLFIRFYSARLRPRLKL